MTLNQAIEIMDELFGPNSIPTVSGNAWAVVKANLTTPPKVAFSDDDVTYAMQAWSGYWCDCNDANVCGNNRDAMEKTLESLSARLAQPVVAESLIREAHAALGKMIAKSEDADADEIDVLCRLSDALPQQHETQPVVEAKGAEMLKPGPPYSAQQVLELRNRLDDRLRDDEYAISLAVSMIDEFRQTLLSQRQTRGAQVMFADNGEDIERRVAEHAENACPYCGGSGHKDDVTQGTQGGAVAWMKIEREYREWENSCKVDDVGYLSTKLISRPPNNPEEWTPLYTHPAERAAMPDDDLYYLQDSRSYVGNCPSWWAKDRAGYTTKLDEAHRFTFDEAMRQHRERSTDIPWSCSEIDALARLTVDMQCMRRIKDQLAKLSAAPTLGRKEKAG